MFSSFVSTAQLLLAGGFCVVMPAISAAEPSPATDSGPLVKTAGFGKVELVRDKNGDAIPDFSGCGYRGGGVAWPSVSTILTLKPAGEGDDTDRIQAALKTVAGRAPGPDGIRGAVLLERGEYRIAGTLAIPASGMVLRGIGQGEDGTVLIATGTKRRPLIQIGGSVRMTENKEAQTRIIDERVAVGSRVVKVEDASPFRPGHSVLLHRPATPDWINLLGMDQLGQTKGKRNWAPADFEMSYERTVLAVKGQEITLDLPVVCALEKRFGGGRLGRYEVENRLINVGIEDLRLISEYQKGQEDKDEAHATKGVSVVGGEDCWVTRVTALHFANNSVFIGSDSRRITVADCASLEMVSQIIGARRYPFTIEGQQNLVTRCYSRHGRHDFVLGGRVPGPNVFLDCVAEESYAPSEPHHRWATGVLYDNVFISGKGGYLQAANRGTSGSGHGWSGAWVTFWNCRAPLIAVMDPPTARNQVVGVRPSPVDPERIEKNVQFIYRNSGSQLTVNGQVASDGKTFIFSGTAPVLPRSLYLMQLEARLGASAVSAVTSPAQKLGDTAAIENALQAFGKTRGN